VKSARKQHPSLGVFLALSSALLFGLNASTSKVILEQGVSPGHLVMFRSFVTALIAGVILVVRNRSAFRVARGEWKYLLGFGIVGVALMQWAYSNAVLILPVGIALLIEYTAIVMVPIASWLLFKEKIKTRLWIGVALVLGGLVIVSQIWLGGLRADGVGFAFLAAALLSVYFIMGEHIQRDRDTMSTLFYSMLIAGLFWFCVTDWWTFDLGTLTQLVNLSGNLDQSFLPLWALLIWLGVMGTFAPMALSYRSLVHLSASGVGIASTAETVFAFIFGWLWLGEEINGLQTVGGLLVISGIVIAQTSRVAKEPVFVK
jgi:hypothetical protein